MPSAGLGDVLADGGRNAAIAWGLVVLAGVSWVGGYVLVGPLWSVFALVVLVLALIPPVAYRSQYVMLPWEVIAMAALPLIGIAVGSQRLSSPIVAYLAIAAVALVIVVELHSFTSIRMSPGFAIVLVIATTMAAAAAWALLQWYVAVLMDRSFTTTNDELMIEFLYAALAGFGAGVLFRTYFRRRVSATERIPADVRTDVLTGGEIDER